MKMKAKTATKIGTNTSGVIYAVTALVPNEEPLSHRATFSMLFCPFEGGVRA
jgi:hypothetical protein